MCHDGSNLQPKVVRLQIVHQFSGEHKFHSQPLEIFPADITTIGQSSPYLPPCQLLLSSMSRWSRSGLPSLDARYILSSRDSRPPPSAAAAATGGPSLSWSKSMAFAVAFESAS